MRTRDELAEEMLLRVMSGPASPIDSREALVDAMYEMADALLARRAPLGDQPAAYVPRVGDWITPIASCYPYEKDGRRRGPCVIYYVSEKFVAAVWPHSDAVGTLSHKTYVPATPSERVSAGLDQPAASDTPADPRRTVGAVVEYGGNLFVVCVYGDGPRRQRGIDSDPHEEPYGTAYDNDRFVRWATRAECERHGIPYVDRDAKPASPARSERPTHVRIINNRGLPQYLGEIVAVTWVGDVPNAPGCGGGLYALPTDSWEPTPAPRDEVAEAKKINAAFDATDGACCPTSFRLGYLACARARDGGR